MVSILRLVWLVQLYYYPEVDSTYDIRFVYVEIETCLAITAACGPALKPLVDKYFPVHYTVSTSSKPSEDIVVDTNRSANMTTTAQRLRPASDPETPSFALRDLRNGVNRELRNESPTGSEDDMMTYHSIIRTREYTVRYSNKGEEDQRGRPLSQDGVL